MEAPNLFVLMGVDASDATAMAKGLRLKLGFKK